MSTRIKDPEIRSLNRIMRLIEKMLPAISPAGKTWLRERLNAVELHRG